MQFQVPQFIETEDRIVGPLTLKQFLYLAAAGGVSFVLYYVVTFWAWSILSFIVVVGTLAIAFLKINGRSMLNVIGSAFSFYWNPQTYVWRLDRPYVKKEEEIAESGFLDRVVSGIALKETWRSLQTGVPPKPRERQERYEIYQRAAGDRQAARRVDYR